MAFLVIVINTDNHSIADLNHKIGTDATKPHGSVVNCAKYLEAIAVGAVNANVQVVSRSTDPSVGTAGSGSASTAFTLK